MSQPEIPYDIYDSPAEMVVHLPLGGVTKESISLSLDENTLTISAERTQPSLKPTLVAKNSQCYRGSFTTSFALPSTSYFNGITSNLTPENILIITIPKVLVPQTVPVTIH